MPLHLSLLQFGTTFVLQSSKRKSKFHVTCYMQEEIKKRTKAIALRVIEIANDLTDTNASRIIARQIIRSASSIRANYRAACRAKSTADFINKLKIVEEETDETLYWLEILEESNLTRMGASTLNLKKETNEILAIIVKTTRTLRMKVNQEKQSKTANPKP